MQPGTSQNRDTWGSKTAFILAAAGSAIGLGNIWGFPTQAGMNGGAAFLVIYLIAVAVVGAPVMLAELMIGRHTLRNPVGAFKLLAPGAPWWLIGAMGVLAGVIILSFYSVLAGWTMAYIVKAATGAFSANADTAQMFVDIAARPLPAISWHLAFIALTVFVVVGGVRDGIERWTKVLMPVLLVLLALLALRAVTLPGAGTGLEFYLRPDFSVVTPQVVLAAVGQAFFSLSLGMGAIITYGSYLSKKDELVTSAGWVTGLDTGIAFLAGLIIFPTMFATGFDATVEGPRMVFVILPSLLATMPPEPYGGLIFGTGFFILLGIAALTSSISLLEVGVTWAVDEKKWPRKRAAILLGAIAFVIGIPSALANGAVDWLTSVPGIGMDFLSLLFTIFGSFALIVGALFISLFVGWKWGVEAAGTEVRETDGRFRLEGIWKFLIRFVCPVALLIILVQTLISTF
ncbi:MAG: sodium-dependent transporter [Gemmatimonadota bacterium]|nr:sodium-dependent transporter [Gemmatimonadota bacterium]